MLYLELWSLKITFKLGAQHPHSDMYKEERKQRGKDMHSLIVLELLVFRIFSFQFPFESGSISQKSRCKHNWKQSSYA